MAFSKETLDKAMAGDASAAAECATAYYTGDGVAQDYGRAYTLFLQGAEGGSGWARYMLGVMSQEGQGADKNIVTAINHYQQAAEAGVSLASMNLGILYQVGSEGHMEPDWTKAAVYYEKAADQGNEKAAHNLAALYHTGIGGQPDFEAAKVWYERARTMGHPKAEESLIEIRKILDPQSATREAVAAYRNKPVSLWDRLLGRR